MKLFKHIEEKYPQEAKDKILASAKTLGLDKIDFEKTYVVNKKAAKNKSSNDYPDSFHVCTGNIYLIGDENGQHVWLGIFGTGSFEWFKTSPIKAVTAIGTCFELETENSFYLLMEKI